MNRRPSTKGNAEIVDKYIGTGYDVVKYVHDNMAMLNYLTSSIPNALKYLGGYNEPPTVRLDGSPIQDGDFYFDTDTYALNYYHLADGVWFAVDPDAIVASMRRAEAAAKESQTFARVAEQSAVTTAKHVAAATDSVASARIYQEEAEVQANLAKGSATASGVSADASKVSETSAAKSAADAIVALAQAVTQAQNALASANTATAQSQAAKVSADKAKVSETASKQSETVAQTSKDTAVASATTATEQANLARMWAVDDPLNSARYWAEQSHLAATGAVLSGGVFDPAKDAVKEYPNVVGLTIDTVWFISMGDRTVYTFRTGALAGQITTSGDQLFYDTPNNTWTLIKAGWINPVITVNGKKGPDVTLGATDVGTYDKVVIDKAIADSVAVSSVNNQTGAVVLDHADVGAVSELGGTIRGKVIVAAPAEQLVLRETDTADSDYVLDVSNGNLNIHDSTGLKLTFQKGNETLLNGGLNCSGQVKDTGKRVYGPDNKPSTADLGAINKAGDSGVGSLVLAPLKTLSASLVHQAGYMQMNPFNADYGTSSAYARLYYKAHDNSLPAALNPGIVIDFHDNAGVSQQGNIWLNGCRVYHEAFKPTANDVGALPLAGGRLAGSLAITGALTVTANDNTANFGIGSTEVFLNNSKSSKYLQLRNDGVLAYDSKKIYHEGFKPTSSDVGAVPTTGGTMTGALGFTGANGITMKDGKRTLWSHSNGHVTLSADSAAGNLYLGYNSGTDFQTGKVLLFTDLFSGTGTAVRIASKEGQLFDTGNRVYSASNKPQPADLGMYTNAQIDTNVTAASNLAKTAQNTANAVTASTVGIAATDVNSAWNGRESIDFNMVGGRHYNFNANGNMHFFNNGVLKSAIIGETGDIVGSAWGGGGLMQWLVNKGLSNMVATYEGVRLLGASNPRLELANNTAGMLMYLSGSTIIVSTSNGVGDDTGQRLTLSVAGTMQIQGAGYAISGWAQGSDERLKKNMVNAGGLEKVAKLQGYVWDWDFRDGGRSAGVSAQELQKVLPEVVDTNADYLSVNYAGVTALLVNAVNELSVQVKELQAQLKQR